jgi:filamentous hemagglutinin
MLPGLFYFSCAGGLTDVEHANNALSPIFNKEKEQKRLKQAQMIGEIGAQVMDIVRTEGELKAQKAAEAKGDATVERPKEGDPTQKWEEYKKAQTESPTYKAEMQKYGTGSDFQRAAQAATAAIQALAGGDIQKSIASGASPYLAQLVKDVTLPKDESKITTSDIAANAMAHAVVGRWSRSCRVRMLRGRLNKNPQAPSSDRTAAENVLKDMQNALKGKK